MPKKTEKEPLLFVDTGYIGCFVNEQSYFKTPTLKPNDVSNSDYVHNYANSDFFDFDHFNVRDDQSVVFQESQLAKPSVLLDEEDHYEKVDIFIDEEEDEEDDEQKVSEGASDLYNNVTIEEVEVDVDEPEVDVLTEIEALAMSDEVSETLSLSEVIVSTDEINQEVVEEELDEKQKELFLFIQDLTNRPSNLKAPIVQIVQKDGSLLSGILNLVDSKTVSIDTLMDEHEQILIANIEGIRIVHM